MRIALQGPIQKLTGPVLYFQRETESRVLLLPQGRKPVTRRKRDAPDISGHFQLDADLKQFANRSRALNPANTRAHSARFAPWFVVGHFKGDPHIFQHVMLGLVTAAVAIDDQGRGALLKWPA